MSTHLTSIVLNSLADGELSPEELAATQQHLETCPACTSKALGQALLKAAVTKTGRRYSPSSDLADRLKHLVSSHPPTPEVPQAPVRRASPSLGTRGLAFAGWALAAVFLLVSVGVMRRDLPGLSTSSTSRAVLATEISDLHIAALASSAPPQVISTDRHTVKPWFQGKIPFSFNLPEQLPADVKLEGANLIYLDGQPVAQLFYSIGRHRVSVFFRQRMAASTADSILPTEQSGFHFAGFRTSELDAAAISDVDPTRLSGLVALIEKAQTN